MLINCLNCGKSFYAKPYEVKKKGRKYCSISCYAAYYNKNVRTQYPINRKCVVCRKEFTVVSSRMGSKRYCSRSCAATESNKNRKGTHYVGSTNTFRGKLLKIFGHCCVVCGYKKFVAAHHIKKKSEGGSDDLSNGAILCPNHHKEADTGVLSKRELKICCKRRSQRLE